MPFERQLKYPRGFFHGRSSARFPCAWLSTLLLRWVGRIFVRWLLALLQILLLLGVPVLHLLCLLLMLLF
jgi:hypothetical protein